MSQLNYHRNYYSSALPSSYWCYTLLQQLTLRLLWKVIKSIKLRVGNLKCFMAMNCLEHSHWIRRQTSEIRLEMAHGVHVRMSWRKLSWVLSMLSMMILGHPIVRHFMYQLTLDVQTMSMSDGWFGSILMVERRRRNFTMIFKVKLCSFLSKIEFLRWQKNCDTPMTPQ